MVIELGNIESLLEKPFLIGRLPMTVSQTVKAKVRKDILEWFSSNEHSVSISKEQKRKIDTKKDQPIFTEFLHSSSIETQRLFDQLHSDTFRLGILNQIWAKAIVNRKDRYWLELLLAGTIGFDCFETRIELSVMPKASSIVPHTDSIGKIFSGLFYLPSQDQLEHQASDSLGTSFWHSEQKNFNNRHLVDLDERQSFHKSSALLFRTPFDDNFMWFFLRNSRSWHSVEKLDHLHNHQKRVSINYNIILRGSILKKLFAKLR